jgi:hypothetical protein
MMPTARMLGASAPAPSSVILSMIVQAPAIHVLREKPVMRPVINVLNASKTAIVMMRTESSVTALKSVAAASVYQAIHPAAPG